MPKTLTFPQYLTTAMDNIKDIVVLVGVEGQETYRLMFANKSFHDITGFPTNCIGERVSELVNPETFVFVKKQYGKVVEFKQPLEYTHWFTVPNGRRAFEVEMIPIFNASETVVQILSIARDVSEMAKLKEELRTVRASQYKNR
jgi:PAS domain S-box-containing protein